MPFPAIGAYMTLSSPQFRTTKQVKITSGELEYKVFLIK
jgi:hypothetical protein